MKLSLLFSIAFISIAISINAKNVKGIIILNNNDTIHAEIYIKTNLLSKDIELESMQNRIFYSDTSKIEKSITAHEAKEVVFKYEDETIRMVGVSNVSQIDKTLLLKSEQSKRIFLKILYDGKLKLFDFFHTETPPPNLGPNNTFTYSGKVQLDRYVIQKDTGDIAKLKHVGFKNQILNYISDCPIISNKVSKKE
jgi:hypothetical protein